MFRQQYGPELLEIDDVVLTRCRAIPFVHFNAVLNLGVDSPATEARVDVIAAAYDAAGIRRFTVVHNPFCRPPELAAWLLARGLQPRTGWDRVYRVAPRDAAAPPPARG